MFGIKQYDTDGGIPLTDRELQRRWAQFHGSIRMVSDKWLPRTIGRMLGEDTIRYKVARFFGRPLLKISRAITGRKKQTVLKEEFIFVDIPEHLAFPINYRPQPLASLRIMMSDDEDFGSVEVVIVNEDHLATPPISELNGTLGSSEATWLLLLDASVSPVQQTAVLKVLLTRATDSDDVVFADESGPNPARPILKSRAVGPHTLLSYNVVGRPALLRIATLQSVGGFSTDAGWAYEHDAYLRLSEAGATFHHVPAVLPGGRPIESFAPDRLRGDDCRVVQAALDRRGWVGTVEADEFGTVVRWLLEPPDPLPSIDIVIPTRDRLDLVLQCLTAIETVTTYPNYNIIILDNDSKEPATLEFFSATNYQVVACPGPFNYAHIVNRGVSHSTADYVVTLNNDTIVITPDWLERMVSLASLPDVGIVGGCLLDQTGRFEHESIVIAPYPQHLRSDSNYTNRDQFVSATRDVAAVTGAVQMIEREFWQLLGGMDEQMKVVMNDVDICLRSQLLGRHVLYSPDVRLYHHVSSSRGTLDPLEDRNRFIRRWDIFGTFRDPYFPESLLLLGETIYYRHR